MRCGSDVREECVDFETPISRIISVVTSKSLHMYFEVTRLLLKKAWVTVLCSWWKLLNVPPEYQAWTFVSDEMSCNFTLF